MTRGLTHRAYDEDGNYLYTARNPRPPCPRCERVVCICRRRQARPFGADLADAVTEAVDNFTDGWFK